MWRAFTPLSCCTGPIATFSVTPSCILLPCSVVLSTGVLLGECSTGLVAAQLCIAGHVAFVEALSAPQQAIHSSKHLCERCPPCLCVSLEGAREPVEFEHDRAILCDNEAHVRALAICAPQRVVACLVVGLYIIYEHGDTLAEAFAGVAELLVDEVGIRKPRRVVVGLRDGAGGLHHLPRVWHVIRGERMDFRHIPVHHMEFRAEHRRECVRGGDVGLELGSAVVSELQDDRGCLEQLGE